MQLAQIVTGDVFDDAAAGFDLNAFVVDGADADNVVARRAEAETVRPADVGRQRAAERGVLGIGYIERKALIFSGQKSLKASEGDPRLHGDRHVAGGVIDDLRQAAQIDGQARFRRRQADAQQRPPADRIDRLLVGNRAANHLAHLGDGPRLHERQRAKIVDAASIFVHVVHESIEGRSRDRL